jgi:hypothetical protein
MNDNKVSGLHTVRAIDVIHIYIQYYIKYIRYGIISEIDINK